MSKKKRMHYAKHCGNKVRYWSQEAADEAVATLLASEDYNGSNRRRKRLHSYRCDYCTDWHIGHLRLKDRLLPDQEGEA